MSDIIYYSVVSSCNMYIYVYLCVILCAYDVFLCMCMETHTCQRMYVYTSLQIFPTAI